MVGQRRRPQAPGGSSMTKSERLVIRLSVKPLRPKLKALSERCRPEQVGQLGEGHGQ
jgi:hypothetical protein